MNGLRHSSRDGRAPDCRDLHWLHRTRRRGGWVLNGPSRWRTRTCAPEVLDHALNSCAAPLAPPATAAPLLDPLMNLWRAERHAIRQGCLREKWWRTNATEVAKEVNTQGQGR